MRPHEKRVVCNVVLFVILVILSGATMEYQLLHESILSGQLRSASKPRSRFSTFTEDLYSFVTLQQIFLSGNGRHDCVTLAYYPPTEQPQDVTTPATRLGAPRHPGVAVPNASDAVVVVRRTAPSSTTPPSPSRQIPLEAIRLRSFIVSRESAVGLVSPDAIAWRVQTERLGSSLLASPRTTAAATAAPEVMARPADKTSIPSPTVFPATPLPATPVSTRSATAGMPTSSPPSPSFVPSLEAAGLQESLQVPRRANAVVVLMSPTFSSETVPTAIHVDTAGPAAFTYGAGRTQADTSTPAVTNPAAANPWRCRRCQQFLEKLLPSLEEAFLHRHSYPVHIFHRGIMPNEVVQYITTILPSATRVTIEDVAGVLSERVTPTSAVVLEPWLREMGADLHYRKRFTTVSPPSTPPPLTTRAGHDGVDVRPSATTAPPGGNAGGDGGITHGAAGGNDGAAGGVGVNGGVVNGGGGGGGGHYNRYTASPFDEPDTITQALRERWELRRFWTGLLALLPSLQSYDFFWYVDSQSSFTKPLDRDLLADVANHTCAVAYRKADYLTHKRVTDLWESLVAWNAQSAGGYFSPGELRRALAWLSDGQRSYGGKVYASDCFVMSFAVTRHPAYVDFFHWIDERPPHGLMKQQWSPMAIYTVFAELLMEKHGWDSCVLDPISGYRTA